MTGDVENDGATARPRRHPITPSTSDGRPAGPQSAAQAARAGRAPGRSISAGRSRRLIDPCAAESKRARPAGPCGAIGRSGDIVDGGGWPASKTLEVALNDWPTCPGEELFREYHGAGAL